jgi:S-DNA-T family DNA segregation ATPase FtsK/SpoIIIE
MLDKVIDEMEDRYTKLREAGVKNIQQYNQKHPHDKWAYQVVVIDEFSDLMCVDDSVEKFVLRLGQKARAAGIHVIIATQKPSKDVVTSVIKSNMVTRIGFTCKTHNDYMTIFGRTIPYRLLGMGDGVADIPESSTQFVRFQSPINEDGDIFDKIVGKWGGKVKREIEDEVEAEYEEIDEQEGIDEKYLLLKKVICETGETRMAQLRKMTFLNQNKLQEYLNQLVEEGWLEKGSSKQSGTKLLLTKEDRERFLDMYNEED